MFHLRFQNPDIEYDDRQSAGPLPEAEVLERFESYPWAEESRAAVRYKRSSPTFVVHDLAYKSQLMFFLADADPHLFLLFYGTNERRSFLGIFSWSRSVVFKTPDVDFRTAIEAVRCFCSGDEQRLMDLVSWTQSNE